MLLPKGITGVTKNPENALQKQNGKQFKKICYSYIMRNGGKIINFAEPEIDTNFFKIEVEIFRKHLYILLNEYYPFLAIASTIGYFNLNIVDEIELTKNLKPFYRVLGRKELNEPLQLSRNSKKPTLQNDNELDKCELEQLIYWKPTTIGEVIFNRWD